MRDGKISSEWLRGAALYAARPCIVISPLPVKKQLTFQFRSEVFNLANRVQFGPPDTTYQPPDTAEHSVRLRHKSEQSTAGLSVQSADHLLTRGA